MAPRKRYWFRFYVEAVADPKLRQLSPAHRWLWVAVLAAARQSPIPGTLMISEHQVMNESMLSDFAAMRRNDARAGLRLLDEIGVIAWDADLGTWRVPQWSTRQFESDEANVRSRRHRSKQRANDAACNVASMGDATPPETETETETEDIASVTPTVKRDELFDALAEACGVDVSQVTRSARGALNRALADLREVGATPDEIKARAKQHRRKWPTITVTPMSLAKHWPELHVPNRGRWDEGITYR